MTHLPYLSVYADCLGCTESARPLYGVCGTLSLKYLDSPIAKRVEDFAKEGPPGDEKPEAISLDIVTGGGKTFHRVFTRFAGRVSSAAGTWP